MFHVGKEFFSFEGVKAAVEQYHAFSFCQYYIRSEQQKDSCNNNVYTDWRDFFVFDIKIYKDEVRLNLQTFRLYGVIWVHTCLNFFKNFENIGGR